MPQVKEKLVADLELMRLRMKGTQLFWTDKY